MSIISALKSDSSSINTKSSSKSSLNTSNKANSMGFVGELGSQVSDAASNLLRYFTGNSKKLTTSSSTTKLVIKNLNLKFTANPTLKKNIFKYDMDPLVWKLGDIRA